MSSSDDSMNWDIVFTATERGFAATEAKAYALLDVMQKLFDEGTISGDTFDRFGQMVTDSGNRAVIATEQIQAYLKTKDEILASDPFQQSGRQFDEDIARQRAELKAFSAQLRETMTEEARLKDSAFASPYQSKGINDQYLARDAANRKYESDLIKSQMQTDAVQKAEREAYVAFEASTYNSLMFEQDRFDARKVATEEKAVEAQIAAAEKYRATETETYNQLLYEQAQYDSKKLASEQRTIEEQRAARESYVAFETSTYNQLLFEQQKYDAKVIADQEQVALRARATSTSLIYPVQNRIASTAERTATTSLAPIEGSSLGALNANYKLVDLQRQLGAATQKAQAETDALGQAYQQAATKAAEMGKAWSPAQQTVQTQELRASVDQVTKSYLNNVKAIEANATAVKGFDAGAVKATGAIRGLGNFYPLILQTAVWSKVSKDMLGFGADAIKTAAQYQDSFASVARTAQVVGPNVSGQLAYIKKALMDLDTQMPVTFDDLSKIATMGNEMGIQANGILGFTKTVAEYSTITGTSIQDTANAIGAVGNILHLSSDEYERLGSAISLTGRLSLASETEITGMTEKIAATAHQAGFTAQQIVGLAATLASVKEPAERSQGALEKWTSVANTAAADGGAKLDAFAKAIGKTATETKVLIASNPSQFLQDFLKYLNSLDSAGKTKALSELGLGGIRTSEVLRRLSDNMPLLIRLIGDANKGYKEGTDLADQYGKRTKTLAQQFIELQNAVANVFADLGSTPAIQNLAGLVGVLKDIVVHIADWVQHNQGLAGTAVVITILIGLYAAVRAAIFGAALMANIFNAAEARVAGTSTLQNLGVLIRMFLGIGGAGTVGSVGLKTFAAGEDAAAFSAKALYATLSLGLSLVLTYIISLLLDTRGTLIWTAQAMVAIEPEIEVVTGLLFDLISVVEQLGAIIMNTIGAVTSVFGLMPNALSDFFGGWGGALQKGSDDFQKTSQNIGKSVDALQKKFLAAAKAMKDPNALPKLEAPKADVNALAMADYQKRLAALDAAQQKAAASAGDVAGGINGVGDAAQKQVTTLEDYANDLSSVFKRAFDIQFGPTKAADAIVTQFQQMKDAANSARKDIQSAHDTINKLEADIGKTRADNVKQQYFLSVANQFGDSTRAQEIQGTIDTNNATISDDRSQLLQAQTDLSAATDKLSTSFKSNSAGAIANKEALFELFGKYQDYITALASSGANQKTLEAATKKAKDQFDAQARSLGFLPGDIATVDRSFEGMITTIARIPRNITVKANTDPALQAINEFVAKAQSKLSSLASKPINIPAPTFDPSNNAKAIRTAIEAEMAPYIAYLKFAAADGSVADPATIKRYDDRLSILRAELALYADGGYTGAGAKYEPAGIVHRGEYVVPANLVNQNTGLPYADALGRLASGTAQQSTYARGGYVNPDMIVVEPGPKFIREIRNMVRTEVHAVITPGQIANAGNAQNALNRRRGR